MSATRPSTCASPVFDEPICAGELERHHLRTLTRIIDADFVQSLKDDPNQLTQDDTILHQTEAGHYQVVFAGALAEALGWQAKDVLLDVDGYEIAGINDYVEAYASLADRERLTLTVLRDGQALSLRYRIE